MGLTPRQHRLLHAHAWNLADAAYDDVEERAELDVVAGGWWYFFDRLPPCTYRQGVDWRRLFARSIVGLAEDLEAGSDPVPRTMSEQVALLLIVEDASSALANNDYDSDIATLPASAGDSDWTAPLRELSNGSVVARLYDAQLASTWLRLFPMETWFDAHEPEAARDPNRGSYR